MGNLKIIISARVFIGIFVLAVGMLFIPLSLIPSVERHLYAQPSTQQIVVSACPPQISEYLNTGSYRINLCGPFIIGPTTRLEVHDAIGNMVYQSSIDSQKRDERLDFSVTNPTTYIISIENGAARVELLRLVGQTVWFESATYPSQPLMIIGIVMAIMGTAILRARYIRELTARLF